LDSDEDDDSETRVSWWSIVYDAKDHYVLEKFVTTGQVKHRDGACESQAREMLVKCTRVVVLNLFVENKNIHLEITRLSKVMARLRGIGSRLP
jgi:hypothetical protein